MQVLDLQEAAIHTEGLPRQKNCFTYPRWLCCGMRCAGLCFPWTLGLWRWWHPQAGTDSTMGLYQRKENEDLLRHWDSDFIVCHNFISVAVTNYPAKKQLEGKEFIWNMIPGYSPSLQGSQGRNSSSQSCYIMSRVGRDKLIRLLLSVGYYWSDFPYSSVVQDQLVKWYQLHSKWLFPP